MRGLVGSVVLLAGGALALGALTAAPGAPGSEADGLYFEAPAGDRYARMDPEGETVLPNGRLLTPAGRQVPTAPHPFGLALSADGTVLVTVNGGIVPFSLTVIRNPESHAPEVLQIPARTETDKRRLPSAFLGVAVDTARGLVYGSGGDTGVVAVFSLATGARRAAIEWGGSRRAEDRHSNGGRARRGAGPAQAGGKGWRPNRHGGARDRLSGAGARDRGPELLRQRRRAGSVGADDRPR